MANQYYESLKFVKKKLTEYLEQIFKVYGNELILRLEDYNLLSYDNNCIETSTATGFIMEEFISSKLQLYSQNHNGTTDIKIERITGSTVNSSYDCFVNYNNILFMINLKIQKSGSNNNAVAAINILHKDYVSENPSQTKSYIILKAMYKFGNSTIDGERKKIVTGIDSYCLEEIDFSGGHKQDSRNWSQELNKNSGRMQVSPKFKKEHTLSEGDISYEKTKSFIDSIYKNNK